MDTVDLPTPPLPDATATIFLTPRRPLGWLLAAAVLRVLLAPAVEVDDDEDDDEDDDDDDDDAAAFAMVTLISLAHGNSFCSKVVIDFLVAR